MCKILAHHVLNGCQHMSKEQTEKLENWMKEVTALLCYQPDIPLQHKVDLSNALKEYFETKSD